jgi:hypothetical protein
MITVLDANATTFTGGDYIKVCSTSRQLVAQWVRQNSVVPASAGLSLRELLVLALRDVDAPV